IVIPPAIFFYYSTLFDSRFKTLQQNLSKDQTEAMVFYFRVLAEAAHPLVTLKLAGLAEEATYQMEDVTFAGDELMNLGFYIDSELHGDYATQRFYLKQI
ncbi:GH36 C-terminal domain-containing protein, partial [Enterococcus faecium]